MCDFSFEECEKLSDEDIVELFASGNYAVIQILINRYMPLILKIAYKYKDFGIDSEDLIQEGLIAVFSAVKSYNREKSKFSTFVSHCVLRAILSQIKNISAAKRIPDNLISTLDDAEINSAYISDPESIYISKESFDSLKESISINLSPLEYKVFCAFVAGDSYSKIADDLNITVKSVDNSLKRIRAKLKH